MNFQFQQLFPTATIKESIGGGDLFRLYFSMYKNWKIRCTVHIEKMSRVSISPKAESNATFR